MDLIASLTGKSPSTTGAGSEGALTKGPFNALPPIYDLNAAFVSYVLTGLPIFSTAAGWVGPHHRVDHDISLLVPEIWCRMTPPERVPAYLIRKATSSAAPISITTAAACSRAGSAGASPGVLSRRSVAAARQPERAFRRRVSPPEKQDLDVFADGVDNIVGAMREAAGTTSPTAPSSRPCRRCARCSTSCATENGKTATPTIEFRALFTRESVLASDWYRARLEAQRTVDTHLLDSQARYLEKFPRARRLRRRGHATRRQRPPRAYHRRRRHRARRELSRKAQRDSWRRAGDSPRRWKSDRASVKFRTLSATALRKWREASSEAPVIRAENIPRSIHAAIIRLALRG